MWVDMLAGSVSRFTGRAQPRLHQKRHHPGMTRELLTPAQRIAWAIEQSQKTLVHLADEVGCSHAALSQWSTAKTEADNIKAGLLQRFADATGVELRWLLTGDGPARARYVMESSALILMAREIDNLDGETSKQAERVLRALLPADKGIPN